MNNCKNCQYPFEKAHQYCSNCGARVIRNRLTIANLFSHIVENFLNYDNTFIKTNVHLVTRPAQVIHAYVNGIRKRYSSPISYFAISLTISGLYIFFVQKFYPDVMDMSGIYSGEGTQEVTRKITEFLMDYNSLFYFFLIPAMAFISRLVFLRNGYNYTEHVVIYLYTMSISAIISSLISIVMVIAFPDYYLAWGMTFNIMMVLYHCYILKQVFELSLFGIIKKTLLFLLIFLFFYISISIIIGILLFVFGGFDPADFTPPQN